MINKKSKRGISSIIGTLMMVAVVAVIGSVILFQGLNGINDFNYYLSFLTGSKNNVNESAIIEHVRFNPSAGSNAIDIWVRNTGTSQLEITKVSIVNLNSQVEIIANNNKATIPISQLVNINQSPTSPAGIVWNSVTYCGTATPPPCTISYKISITTSLGNSFETTATPFNT